MDIQEQSKKAIQKTLIYSDIFDYPLTFDQVYTFLIAEKRFPKALLFKQIQLMKTIINKEGYYAFLGRDEIIKRRRQKEAYNRIKIEKAKNIAKFLSCIPTVFLIGISGGVALQNADKEDDIDFFIITKKNTVWITRLLIITFLAAIGVLRTRESKNLSDKVCVNMLVDETALSFSKQKQDLYVAHEIIQLLPLVERNNMYNRFREKNTWITHFLPHAVSEKKPITTAFYLPFFHTILENVLSQPFLEKMAVFLQKKRMQGHITSETLSSSVLAFHPYDYHKKTLVLYNKRIVDEKI